MNSKQTVPLAVSLAPIIAAAPAVAIGAAIGLAGVWLVKYLMAGDEATPPEVTPAKPEVETSRKLAETAAFKQIPAAFPTKSAPAVPVPPVPRPVHVQPVSVASVAVQPAVPIPAITPIAKAPSPAVKKPITRADMATIFDNGKRALSRTAAVAALRRLGFGKSAAYAALSTAGRFSGWLVSAPDGIISWMDKRFNRK